MCAVLAAISSRKEKVWLEFYDIQPFLEDMLEAQQLSKSKRSARRKAAIREFVPKFVERGAGAFARSLIDPNITHRVSFARGPDGPIPTTSMTIRRLPLWDALKAMDDGGPFAQSAAANKKWCWGADR